MKIDSAVRGRAAEVRRGASLADMTTAKIGGVAERLHVPRRGDDLSLLPAEDGAYRVISGGSNLLVSDKHPFADVISMREFDGSIERLGAGRYRVGASVRVQRLIKAINADGYGGIEELVSLPAVLGGLICMNASVPNRACISDYLLAVEVYDGSRVVEMLRDECRFARRSSRFRDGRSIVLSATFAFPEQDPAVSAERIAARKARVREIHDFSAPCFGSVFVERSSKIMSAARLPCLGSGECRFSGKTPNWLLCGWGYSDALAAIRRVEAAHRFFDRECRREVVVWE